MNNCRRCQSFSYENAGCCSSFGSQGCIYVGTADAPTGMYNTPNGKPLQICPGDEIRLWSDGGIFANTTRGSALIQLEPNILFVSDTMSSSGQTGSLGAGNKKQPALWIQSNLGKINVWNPTLQSWSKLSGAIVPRYPAPGFTGVSEYSSCIIRSNLIGGVTVTKGLTGVNDIFGTNFGFEYTITIPEIDELEHLTLVDRVPFGTNAYFRIIIKWDNSFINQDFKNIVIPTFTYGYLGSGSQPSYSNTVTRLRSANSGSNSVSIYAVNPGSLYIDVLLQDSASVWFCANISM